MGKRVRKVIKAQHPASYTQVDPMRGVKSIAGIRIYDVGQGDAICVLDQDRKPFLQIDYGGKYSNPFADDDQVDERMPLKNVRLIMLTHWDEDHWCSASKNTLSKQRAWLVPRQRTSPRAALFSATLGQAYCVPETDVGKSIFFQAQNGDRVVFQKIAHMPEPTHEEDCNATGIAFAVENRNSVILLPGDAPYDQVELFDNLVTSGKSLHAIVAFHHGSRRHWTTATHKYLRRWSVLKPPGTVVFSYGKGNPYRHPGQGNYRSSLSDWQHLLTPDLREHGQGHQDILF